VATASPHTAWLRVVGDALEHWMAQNPDIRNEWVLLPDPEIPQPRPKDAAES
jgi:hypothetical protein